MKQKVILDRIGLADELLDVQSYSCPNCKGEFYLEPVEQLKFCPSCGLEVEGIE